MDFVSSATPQQTPSAIANESPNSGTIRHRTPPLAHRRLHRQKGIAPPLQHLPFSSGISTRQTSLGQQLADCRRNTIRESQRVETPAWVRAVDDVVTGGGGDLTRGAGSYNDHNFLASSPDGRLASTNDRFHYFESYGSLFKKSKQELQRQLEREQQVEEAEQEVRLRDENDSYDDKHVLPRGRKLKVPLSCDKAASSSLPTTTKTTTTTVGGPRTFDQSLQRDHAFREEEVRKRFIAKSRGFTPLAFRRTKRLDFNDAIAVDSSGDFVTQSRTAHSLTPQPRFFSSDTTFQSASRALLLPLAQSPVTSQPEVERLDENRNHLRMPEHSPAEPAIVQASPCSASNNNVIWRSSAMQREDIRDLRHNRKLGRDLDIDHPPYHHHHHHHHHHHYKANQDLDSSLTGGSETTVTSLPVSPSASSSSFSSLTAQQQQQEQQEEVNFVASSPFGLPKENNLDVASSPQMQRWMTGVVATAQQRQRLLQENSGLSRHLAQVSIRRDLSSAADQAEFGFAAAVAATNNSFNTLHNSRHVSGNANGLSNNSSFATGGSGTMKLPHNLLPIHDAAASKSFSAAVAVSRSRSPASPPSNFANDLPQLRNTQAGSTDGVDDRHERNHSVLSRKRSVTIVSESGDDEAKRACREASTAQRDLLENLRKFALEHVEDVEGDNGEEVGIDDADDSNDDDVAEVDDDLRQLERRQRQQQSLRLQQRQQQGNEHHERENGDEDKELDTTLAITYALNPELANLPPFHVLMQKYLDCREKCLRRGVGATPTVASYDPLKPTKAALTSPELCEASGRYCDPPLHTSSVALARFVTDESIVDAPSRHTGEGETVMREVEAEMCRWFRPWRREFQDARTIRNCDAVAAMPVASLRDMKEMRAMARKIREYSSTSSDNRDDSSNNYINNGASSKRSRTTTRKHISKKDLLFQQQILVQKMQQQSSSATAADDANEKAKARSRKTMTLMFDPMCEVLRDLWSHFQVPFVDRAQFEDWNMRSVSKLNLWVISREISLYLAVKGSATDTLIRLINTRKSIVDRLVEIARDDIFARAEQAWFGLEQEYAACIRGDRSPPRLNNISSGNEIQDGGDRLLRKFGISDPVELEQLGLEFLALVLALRRISSDVIDALVLSNSLPYNGPRIKLRELEDQHLLGMKSDLIRQIGDTPLLRLLSHAHPLEKRKRPVNSPKSSSQKCLSYWDRVIEATTDLFRGKAIPLSHDNVFLLPQAAHQRCSSEAYEAVRALIDKKHRELRAQGRVDKPHHRYQQKDRESRSPRRGTPGHLCSSFATDTKDISSFSASATSPSLSSRSVSTPRMPGSLNLQEIQKQFQRNHHVSHSAATSLGGRNLNNSNNNNKSDSNNNNQYQLHHQRDLAGVELDLELLEKANILIGGDKRTSHTAAPNSVQITTFSNASKQQQTKKSTCASLGLFQPLFGKQEPRGLTKNHQNAKQHKSSRRGEKSSFAENGDDESIGGPLFASAGNDWRDERSSRPEAASHISGAGEGAGGTHAATLRIGGGEGVEISVRAVQQLELDHANTLDPLEELEREKELTIEAILRSQVPDFLAKTEQCRLIVMKNGASGLRKEFVVEVPIKVARDRRNLSRRQLQLYANATKQVADALASHPTFKIQWISSQEESDQASQPRKDYFEQLERARIQQERHEQRQMRATATVLVGGDGKSNKISGNNNNSNLAAGGSAEETVQVPPYQYPEEVWSSSGSDNAKPPEVEALSRLSALEEFVLRLRRSLDPDILEKTLIINDTDTCDEKVRAVLNVALPPTFYQHTRMINHESSKHQAEAGVRERGHDAPQTRVVAMLSHDRQRKSQREGLTNARAKKHPTEIAGFVQSPVFEFTKDARNMTFRPISNETLLGTDQLEHSLEKFVALCRERLLRVACKKVARGCKKRLVGTIFGSLSDMLKKDRAARDRALAAALDDDSGEEGFVEWLVQHGTIDAAKAASLRDAFSNSWDEAAKFCRDHNIDDVNGEENVVFLNTLLRHLSPDAMIAGAAGALSVAIREQEENNETDEIWRNPKVSRAQAELLTKEQLQNRAVAHDVEAKSCWPRHLMPPKKGDTFLFAK